MKLLDLFCGAGGAAVGYHRAGFAEITGVDSKSQPRYPFSLVQADALWFLEHYGHEYDAIHASPPCQRYSVSTKSNPGRSEKHPDLVAPTRDLLMKAGAPFVIENVVGAPLHTSVTLCGSMFGLLVQRHRLFEYSFPVEDRPACDHSVFVGNYPCGRSNWGDRAGEKSKVVHVYGQGCSRGPRSLWCKAMGIDWMTMKEMAQAIPPAYTQWIGERLLAAASNTKGSP